MNEPRTPLAAIETARKKLREVADALVVVDNLRRANLERAVAAEERADRAETALAELAEAEIAFHRSLDRKVGQSSALARVQNARAAAAGLLPSDPQPAPQYEPALDPALRPEWADPSDPQPACSCHCHDIAHQDGSDDWGPCIPACVESCAALPETETDHD